MATYVELDQCNVKEIFDAKFSADLKKKAEQAMLAGIKDPLTRTKPTDKDARGYSLTLNLFLTLDKSKKELAAKCEVLINGWPQKVLKRNAMGRGRTQVDPAKVTKGDVDAVADVMMKGAVEISTKYMKDTEP